MTMFTPQEKKNLKKLLARAVNQDEVMTLDGLHGYFYGLVIIPEPILPSEWLAEFFGEDMMEAVTEEEAGPILNSLFSAYNRMTKENEHDKLTFPFDIDTIKAKDIQRIREWAHGFFMATNLRPEVWGMDDDKELDDEEFCAEGQFESMLESDENFDDNEFIDDDDAEIAASFAIVMGVAFPEQISELFDNVDNNIIPLASTDPELEARLFALLPDAVASLQVYANAARDGLNELKDLKADNYPEPPQPRQVEKIGRNDPCPCGSSSKYKKCCGK